MTNYRRQLFILSSILCFVLIGTIASADIKGRLVVEILDGKGEPISDVKIKLTSTESADIVYDIVTNKKGKATLAGVDPVLFKVVAEKDGYQKLEGEIKLRAGIKVLQKWTMLTEQEAIESSKATQIAGFSPEKKAEYDAGQVLNKGIDAYKNNNLEEAKTHFLEAIKIFPNISFVPHMILGEMAFQEKNATEAVKYLEKARELDVEGSEKASICRILGASYMIIEDFAKAKAVWSDLVQTTPDAAVLENLAKMDIHDKNYDGAIKWLKICREKNPTLVDPMILLGDLYLQEKKTTEALDVYEGVVILLEKDPQTNAEKLKNAKDTVKALKELLKKK